MEVESLQEHEYRILVINPGSTSTKIGVFDNEISFWKKQSDIIQKRLENFQSIIDQYEFRKANDFRNTGLRRN